jgi:alkylhydroperoxidase family enzyme
VSPPRIPPRPAEEWDAQVYDALSVLDLGPRNGQAEPAQPHAGPRPVGNIIATFAWHPALTKGWLTFNNHLFHSTLSDRVCELAETRILWLRRGEYEWNHHANRARAAGVSEEEIEAICEGPDSKVWGPFDAALMRAVDELCFDRYISDATWAKLSEHLDRQQLMDLVFSVGAYELLATAFNTFGLEMDPGMQGWAQLPDHLRAQAGTTPTP